jgi:hypothetical protein
MTLFSHNNRPEMTERYIYPETEIYGTQNPEWAVRPKDYTRNFY